MLYFLLYISVYIQKLLFFTTVKGLMLLKEDVHTFGIAVVANVDFSTKQ